ncbi:Transmembrane protein 18 [Nibea albiflora]|uniref:Transmembrane protein 18 n=1 Tax=Nibea albiflora TaxID=240163 RepID=A0ACB7FBN9_NIBAL|nr:Transmembrane protein 18 [Nibea albiflora]
MTQQKAQNISSIPIDAFSNLRITSIWTFLMSVQWSEPWLIGLLVFHVVCLCLTVVTCRYYRAQICHFLLMVGLVYSAEYLNELAAMNWKSFSDFQYFDSKGMFISLVYSIPLLLNTVIIVVQANCQPHIPQQHTTAGNITVVTPIVTLSREK